MTKSKHSHKPADFLNHINQVASSTIANIIGLVSGIITILQLLPEDGRNYARFIITIKSWIDDYPLVLVALWSLVAVILILKYRSSAIMTMNVSSVNMAGLIADSKEAMMTIRDIDMDEVNESCEKDSTTCEQLQNAQKELLKSNRLVMNQAFLCYTTEFLDKVRVIVESYTGRAISTCFKMCVEYQDNNTGQKRPGTVTLARDRDSDAERTFHDVEEVVPLEMNSDFYEIVNDRYRSPSKTYFYQADLKRYKRELNKISDGRHRYENSNHEWNTHYNATVVVPVKNLVIEGDAKKNEILGFLCVDSMSPTAFTEKQKVINVRLMQCFADVFSVVLAEYKNKLENKNERVGNV